MWTINYIKQLCGIAAKFQCSCFNQLNPRHVFQGWSFQETREVVSPVKRSPAMSLSVTAWTASSELIGDLAPYIWESWKKGI